jgi:hypothetical protein
VGATRSSARKKEVDTIRKFTAETHASGGSFWPVAMVGGSVTMSILLRIERPLQKQQRPSSIELLRLAAAASGA